MEDILDEQEMRPLKKSDFEFYRDFHNVEEAKGFAKLLDDNGILYLSETTDTLLDQSIVGAGLVPKVIIKLQPQDFKKINGILEAQINEFSAADLESHYLNQLDDDELLDIFEEPDKWTIEDVTIAKILLKSRGVEITKEEIDQLKEERLAHIREGKSGSRFWMTFYFFGIIIGLGISMLLFIAGVGMSYYYAYGKNTDQEGVQHYIFDEQTRYYGYLMFCVGLGVVALEIILLFVIGYF